jgi:hypothetical protein
MVLLVRNSPAETPTVEIAKAKAARVILEKWQHASPESESRYLHLICWTPADREFPDNYSARLTRIMEHIQEFYRGEMERFGFDDHTIQLQYKNDQLVLHAIRGEHPEEYYGKQSGNEIRTECLETLRKAGVDAESETLVIFCNLADWDEQKLKFTHKSPYYAGGTYRSGTAWQLDSPELDTQNIPLLKPIIFDGEYGKISLGRHNSIFIGGVAHELGHALGLPHCRARPDERIRGTALMGSGNRTYGQEVRSEGLGSFMTLAHVLRLASHPQFSGSVKGINAKVESSIEDLKIEADGNAIEVSGTVAGTPPIYAVIAYFDPEGGSDYDSTTATAIPNSDGTFQIRSNALMRGKKGELRLFPLHVNGSASGRMSRTKFRYPYRVDTNGIPDVSTIQVKQELAAFMKAFAGGDRNQAEVLAGTLKHKLAKEIATNLLDRTVSVETPAEYRGQSEAMPLTQFKPSEAKVGWGRPTYNRVPGQTLLLESGGKLFTTGIYAHAPAEHVYNLGAKWNSLEGHVGIDSGHSGSVQFTILGDGKPLWQSDVIKSGVTSFKINLTGINQLKLITDPTADGASSDWGFWFDPILQK